MAYGLLPSFICDRISLLILSIFSISMSLIIFGDCGDLEGVGPFSMTASMLGYSSEEPSSLEKGT